MNKYLLIILLFLTGCFGGSNDRPVETCTSLPSYQLWYEDNNMGRAGGYPSDFHSKFSDPEWDKTYKKLDTYMIRLNVVGQLSDDFIKENLDTIAVDAGGATWMQHNEGRKRLFRQEIQLLQKLKRLGVTVTHVSLQSVLSKPQPDGDHYPLSKRVEDIETYKKVARSVFPEVKVGLIDAMPTHGKNWRHAYSKVRVDYIHVDVPEEKLDVYAMREVEKWVQSRGMEFGLFLTSRNAGYQSDTAFVQAVRRALSRYQRACGSPDAYIIASWFPHPSKTVPIVTDLINRL